MAQFPIRGAVAERIDLEHAAGRILASPVEANESVPAFDRSMVDGYAVIASDIQGATRVNPARLRLAGASIMGEAPTSVLKRGEAIAVPTGGAIPQATTGIVKIEDTEKNDGQVIIFDATDCEERITHAASDVRAGQHLFDSGKVLTPAAIGLLAAAGVAHVDVYQPPTVGVLITGDELVPPGVPLRLGQIRESNGVTVCSALRAMGFRPHRYERVADNRDVFQRVFDEALAHCDALVISGGSSVGEHDFTAAVVAAAGEPGVIVHGVKAKPGRPVLLALIGDKLVIGLPGNPVSALVMLEALGKPLLLRMFDKTDNQIPFRARLAQRLEVEPGLEYRIPVQLRRDGDGVVATPLLGTSSQMHILGFADAIIVVPEGSTVIEAGTLVNALPFSRTRTLS